MTGAGPAIGILDYGIGNITSVARALEACGGIPVLVGDPSALKGLCALVLPGVGAFGQACRSMRGSGMDAAAHDFICSGRPVLGICLGMQLMFESSEESEGYPGLSLFRGTNRKLSCTPAAEGEGKGAIACRTSVKVPHTGWNDVLPEGSALEPLMGREARKFYYTHSYAAFPEDEAIVAARTPLSGLKPGDGETIVAAIRSGNVFGVQFHPEKSGEAGLWMLKAFVGLAEARNA